MSNRQAAFGPRQNESAYGNFLVFAFSTRICQTLKSASSYRTNVRGVYKSDGASYTAQFLADQIHVVEKIQEIGSERISAFCEVCEKVACAVPEIVTLGCAS